MTANPIAGFNELAREVGAQGALVKTGNLDELHAALRATCTERPHLTPANPDGDLTGHRSVPRTRAPAPDRRLPPAHARLANGDTTGHPATETLDQYRPPPALRD